MLPGISQLVMFVSLEYFDKAQFYKQPNFGIVYDIVLKTHQQNMLLSLFAQASQECPGQGNYAAANANLDAFAPYWSAKGRPTLGICSNRGRQVQLMSVETASRKMSWSNRMQSSKIIQFPPISGCLGPTVSVQWGPWAPPSVNPWRIGALLEILQFNSFLRWNKTEHLETCTGMGSIFKDQEKTQIHGFSLFKSI